MNPTTKPKNIFSPSLFFKYATCPHWIWHDFYSDPTEKGEVPELAQKLLEQGVLHEEKYIENLVFDRIDTKNLDEAFKQTMVLMKSGVERIYQGVIQYQDGNMLYRGRPDFLERKLLPAHTVDKSQFGNYYYVPVDIKSSREINKEQKLQLVFYAIILENLQSVWPAEVAIINKDFKRLELIIDGEDREKTFDQVRMILKIINGKKPGLKLSSSCKNSPWFNNCKKEAEAAKDIALIYNLDSRAYPTLRSNGINTILDAMEMDINTLPKVPYASDKTLERAKLQAQSLVTGELQWLARPNIPEADLKIYFDIEGDPLLQVEYLFGFWITGDPEGKYANPPAGGGVRMDKETRSYFLYFLAGKPEEEKAMWQQFLEWVEILPENNYCVYHYAPYEKSRTKTMSEKYGTSKAFAHFASKYCDFFDVVKKSVILPLYFYSIKDIAKSPFLKYKWRHAKAGGAQSVFWYEKWLETGDKSVLNDIIDYNEDDVRATEFLHKWLLLRRH